MKEADQGKLQQPPSFSFTAMSGAMAFLAAAMVMWYFAGYNLGPVGQSMPPAWHPFASRLKSSPVALPVTSLSGSTKPLFGSNTVISSPVVLNATAFEKWSGRSSYNFQSIISGSLRQSLAPKFTLLPQGKKSFDVAAKSAAVEVSPTEKHFSSEVLDLLKTPIPQKGALASVEIIERLEKEFSGVSAFFVPDASKKSAKLTVAVGNVEERVHYSTSQRFWYQLEGKTSVAVIEKMSLFSFNASTPLVRNFPSYLSEASFFDFLGAEFSRVSVATLSPGDILAIPPFALVAAMSPANASVTLRLSSSTEAEENLNLMASNSDLTAWINEIAVEFNISATRAAGAVGRHVASKFPKRFSGDGLPFAMMSLEVAKERYGGVTEAVLFDCWESPTLKPTSPVTGKIDEALASAYAAIPKVSPLFAWEAVKSFIDSLAQATEPLGTIPAAEIISCWELQIPDMINLSAWKLGQLDL